jgi:hypothetical protein
MSGISIFVHCQREVDNTREISTTNCYNICVEFHHVFKKCNIIFLSKAAKIQQEEK